MLIALVLAIAGGIMLDRSLDEWLSTWQEIGLSVLAGILATPLAPTAKDVSSALATAVNTLQVVKK